MAKNESWRPRKSRKRGFDDDGPEFGGWAPPPPAPGGGPPPPLRQSSVFASGPEIKAVVKWFNAEKGFGFVELGDGSGDAFLHVSVVQRAGAEAVAPGANLRVRVGPGQKGQQVTEVLEITEGEAPPARTGGFGAGPRPGGMGGPGGGGAGAGGGGSRGFAPSGPAEEVRGTVKWYSAEKGFGFVSPDGGGRDVFVHATALERSGLTPLGEGQAVVMQVVQGKKGPEASSLTKS